MLLPPPLLLLLCRGVTTHINRSHAPSLRNQQEGSVPKAAVDGSYTASGRPTPSSLHELACPLDVETGGVARVPRTLDLTRHWAVAREAPADVEKRCHRLDGGRVLRQVEYDGVKEGRVSSDGIERLFHAAVHMGVRRAIKPALLRALQVVEANCRVLLARLHSHVQPIRAQAARNVHREAGAAQTGLEHAIVAANAEPRDHYSRILWTDDLRTPLHATAELRQPHRKPHE